MIRQGWEYSENAETPYQRLYQLKGFTLHKLGARYKKKQPYIHTTAKLAIFNYVLPARFIGLSR